MSDSWTKKKPPQARIKEIMNKWPNFIFEVGASIFMNRVHEQRESSLSNGRSADIVLIGNEARLKHTWSQSKICLWEVYENVQTKENEKVTEGREREAEEEAEEGK